MPHLFERAPSARSRCRGCRGTIQRDEVRFGERIANPYAEGETTLWFHPACAAYKRPEPLLQALAETKEDIPERKTLQRFAQSSLAHRRLPRIDGADRAPTGQARCRHCREPIARGSWRIQLTFYQEGRFSPGGFIHLNCRKAYFETGDIVDQVLHFSASLDERDREALRQACKSHPA